MNLEGRIKEQFPALVVTLLSVLIGLCFGDLVGIARARMTLWPLDVGTLRTWGQIFSMAGCCVSVWVVFSHMAISRLRLPMFADCLVVFLTPLMILFANSLVGQKEIWPWFYFASAYLTVALVSWQWQIRIAMADSELSSFARLLRPLGPLSVIYFGIPFYAAIGWADSHGFLSPLMEAAIAFGGGPAPLLTSWIFISEWRTAVAQAEASEFQAGAAVRPVDDGWWWIGA